MLSFIFISFAGLLFQLAKSQTILSPDLWIDSTPYTEWDPSIEFTVLSVDYHGYFDINTQTLTRSFIIAQPESQLVHNLNIAYQLIFACGIESWNDEVRFSLYFGGITNNNKKIDHLHERPAESGSGFTETDDAYITAVCNDTYEYEREDVFYGYFNFSFEYTRNDFTQSNQTINVLFQGDLSDTYLNEFWAVNSISIEMSILTDTPTTQPTIQPTTPTSPPTATPLPPTMFPTPQPWHSTTEWSSQPSNSYTSTTITTSEIKNTNNTHTTDSTSTQILINTTSNVALDDNNKRHGVEDEINWNLVHPNVFTVCSLCLIAIVVFMVLYAYLHAKYSSNAIGHYYKYGLITYTVDCMCCCRRINDSVKISSILLFFMHSHSFVIDGIFGIHLYLIGEMELAFISIGSLILSFVLSFVAFVYLRNKWFVNQRDWLRRYTAFMLNLTILTGSTFPVIELCNCGAFGFDVFKMGLTRVQMNEFRTWKLAVLMIVENVPEIYVSLRYYEINNGFDTISLLTLFISVISLIIDISMFIVRMFDKCYDKYLTLMVQIEVILEYDDFKIAKRRSSQYHKLRSSFAKAFKGTLTKHLIEVLFVTPITIKDETKSDHNRNNSLSKNADGFLIELTIEVPENSERDISVQSVKQQLQTMCDETLGGELQRIWKIGNHESDSQRSSIVSTNASHDGFGARGPKRITLKRCEVFSKKRVGEYIREKSNNFNMKIDNDDHENGESVDQIQAEKFNEKYAQHVGSQSSLTNSHLKNANSDHKKDFKHKFKQQIAKQDPELQLAMHTASAHNADVDNAGVDSADYEDGGGHGNQETIIFTPTANENAVGMVDDENQIIYDDDGSIGMVDDKNDNISDAHEELEKNEQQLVKTRHDTFQKSSIGDMVEMVAEQKSESTGSTFGSDSDDMKMHQASHSQFHNTDRNTMNVTMNDDAHSTSHHL